MKNRNKNDDDDSDSDGDNKPICTSVDDATAQHLHTDTLSSIVPFKKPILMWTHSPACSITEPLRARSCSHALAAHIWPRCVLLYGLLPFFMPAFICGIRSREEGKMRGREGRAWKKRSRATQKHTLCSQRAVAPCFNLRARSYSECYLFLWYVCEGGDVQLNHWKCDLSFQIIIITQKDKLFIYGIIRAPMNRV